MQIQATQLTENPQFPDTFEYEENDYFKSNFIGRLLQSFEDDCDKLITNVSSVQADAGVLIVSFKWSGDYEGVIVYQVFLVKE